MRNRKEFLAVMTATASAFALRTAAKADPAVAASAGPAPTSAPALNASPPAQASKATPKPKPSPKPPSAAALATAATMRRFDPHLSDEELATIARGIDDNAKAAVALNPRKKRLANSDEPVTTFRVSPS